MAWRIGGMHFPRCEIVVFVYSRTKTGARGKGKKKPLSLEPSRHLFVALRTSDPSGVHVAYIGQLREQVTALL
jgi:hypothetical protein